MSRSWTAERYRREHTTLVESKKAMRLACPVELNKQANTVLVLFPDVPEALTGGETVEDALAEGADCLVAALGGYIQGGRAIPAPSPAVGAEVVELSPVAAKIAIYKACRAKRLALLSLLAGIRLRGMVLAAR